MNQLEELHAKVRAQADEIQRLRDENNHLKGEQGKPDIKPSKVARQLSSEAERAVPKPRRKRASRSMRIQMCSVSRLRTYRTPPSNRCSYSGSGFGGGPPTFVPARSYSPPWQGQRNWRRFGW